MPFFFTKSHGVFVFVGIYLSSVPPENHRYQNELQKPRVLGRPRPVLRALPSKPLRRGGQGCSAGSSRCREGVVLCGLEGQAPAGAREMPSAKGSSPRCRGTFIPWKAGKLMMLGLEVWAPSRVLGTWLFRGVGFSVQSGNCREAFCAGLPKGILGITNGH